MPFTVNNFPYKIIITQYTKSVNKKREEDYFMVKHTPPLGWNTWNTFADNINEQLIFETVDSIVESGLKNAGYEYVVIDDIWAMKERDENGKLVPDPQKFPHGMKHVADYIHSKGLKFGMYSCAGYLTCAQYPASYGHEWDDAQTFAEWEVDFLKYDYCFHPTTVRADVLYKRMGIALANCGRDILFSACSWGADDTKVWIKETGANMWRSTVDIFDTWESVKKLALSQLSTLEYNGQGCFNDMDMLVVGMNGDGHVGIHGCTDDEYRLHFSLWALLSSPLMIGCDVRSMSEETKKILMNKDIIAINQDRACRQPFFVNDRRLVKNENRKTDEPFYKEYPLEAPIIARFLENGDIAIGIFNFGDAAVAINKRTVTFDSLGLSVESGKTLEVTDLWSGETEVVKNDAFIINGCAEHSCRMFRAKVVDKK